jgi:hypothetical protein
LGACEVVPAGAGEDGGEESFGSCCAGVTAGGDAGFSGCWDSKVDVMTKKEETKIPGNNVVGMN